MKTNSNHHIFFVVSVLASIFFTLHAQDDSRPWERLGLSITEWKLIEKHNMPMSKVEVLLKCGVGISEYFKEPWVALSITEDTWLEYHRNGLSSADIKRKQQIESGEYIENMEPVENTFVEQDVSEEKRALFTSFFAPGYLQVKDSRKVKGRVMIGLAATSVVGTVAFSVVKKQFIPLPLITILIPDMVWSMVDQKNYTKEELK